MPFSNFLSVPVLESRATSSSSSSSSMFGSDLQTSDSQTDYSPPHSPTKDVSHFTEPLFKSFLDHATHLDRGLVTPRQSPRLLDRDRLGKSDDVGYDSEHESSSNNPTKHRPRLLTRKRVVSSRHLVAGVVLDIRVDISPQNPLAATATPKASGCPQDTPSDTPYKVPEPDKICVGLGLNVFQSEEVEKVRRTTDSSLATCTLSSSFSPEPSPCSSLATTSPCLPISLLGVLPQKPRLEPIDAFDNMSPLEPLPPPLDLPIPRNNSQDAPTARSFLSNVGTSEDTEQIFTGPHFAQISDANNPPIAGDTMLIPVHECATSGNKPTHGLGLGLPSGLVTRPAVQCTSHRRVATPLNHVKALPRYGERSHSKEHQYPRRRLYNIHEATSPPSKSFSISYPGAIAFVRRASRCGGLSNYRQASLQLILEADFCHDSMSSQPDILRLRKAKHGRNAKASLSAQKRSSIPSPNSTHQPFSRPERPESPGRSGSAYDTVAPWANTEAPIRPKLSIRSGPYSASGPPARGTIISPVLIHINMPKKLHFANHRHYRTGRTLF